MHAWIARHMETEMQKLEDKNQPQATLHSNETVAGAAAAADMEEELRYTSLKDILSSSSVPLFGSSAYDLGGFDSSTIAIRNQLVKQAASAYLQSAAILASRDRSCLARAWRRVRRRTVATSGWRECVRGPVGEWVVGAVRSLRRMAAYVTAQVGLAWRTGGRSPRSRDAPGRLEDRTS